MDKELKNNIIRTILEQSGITDEDLKQEFLNKYIDSDVKLKDIDRNLEYFIKKDQKKKKQKLDNKNIEEKKVEINDKKNKYMLYKYNNLSIKAKENITIDLLENKKYGTNDVYHVLVNKKDKAYLKSSKHKYIDDIDVSISQFADVFDVDVTKIYRIEDSNGGTGIISYDIETNDNIKYISLRDAYLEYYQEYNKGKIYNLKWIVELLSLPKTSKDNPLTKIEDVRVVIESGINILKDQFNISEENLKELKKEYLKILLFDFATNQTDRSLNNVNLMFDGNNISFAPLYDNGCVYNKELGDNNIYLLDHICTREAFINAIFKYYFDEIENSVKLYLNKKNYIEKIQDILKNNLNEENYKWYYKKINNNIDYIIKLFSQHEEEIVKINEYEPVDLRLQYGYVKTFSLLLSSLLFLLIIIIIVGFFF